MQACCSIHDSASRTAGSGCGLNRSKTDIFLEQILRPLGIVADATEQHDNSLADRGEHRLSTGNTEFARCLDMQLAHHAVLDVHRKAAGT
jgi:hypothetical protein